MGNLKEIILGRRTVHSYKNQKIDHQLILDCLETAKYAPNHRMTNPFRFTLLGPKSREGLFQIALDNKGDVDQKTSEKLRQKVMNPSHCCIISQVISPNEKVQKEDYATLSCVIQNISLILWEQNIGTKWSTGGMMQSPKIYDLAQIDPNVEKVEGIFWMGIPDVVPEAFPRPDLNSILKEVP